MKQNKQTDNKPKRGRPRKADVEAALKLHYIELLGFTIDCMVGTLEERLEALMQFRNGIDEKIQELRMPKPVFYGRTDIVYRRRGK